MKAGSVRTRVLSPQLALRSVAGNSRGLRPQESPRRCGVSPKARPASRASNAHCLVVYKVDRLSRSLLDFAGIMGVLEERGTSFVSITQQFNTTSSIGRLTLNVLLSFAQFEREIISERTRDKMSAARRKGKWVGGIPPRAHARNVQRCYAAIKKHEAKDRKLDILLVHGSGRSSFKRVAHEFSNSQFLLKSAVRQFEGDEKYEITEIRLRDYNISPCNCCYSTTSSLCGFPCNCFPLDPMQELYPLVLNCDVMFCSTGVNQSAMSSRLKLFADRLISLDGGFFVAPAQYREKDADWRDRCLALSTKLGKDLPYDPRTWGRVAAYFIASQGQNK